MIKDSIASIISDVLVVNVISEEKRNNVVILIIEIKPSYKELKNMWIENIIIKKYSIFLISNKIVFIENFAMKYEKKINVNVIIIK